jgi:thioredoxin 1
MIPFRLLAIAATTLFLSLASAHAAERRTFEATDFASAQAQGERILIDISATWCPTCKAQKPTIESLATAPENADLIIYDVDFDSMKDVVRGFGAQMQSTLIAYLGPKETARSVGDTDPTSIAALVASNRKP